MGRKIRYEFTALPNKMYEALIKLKLPLYDRAVFDTIARQTFGYHLPERWIAWSVFVEMTGIDKRNISRAIHSLIKRGIIAKDGKIYSIQPDLSKWEGVSVETHLEEVSPETHLDISRDTLGVSVETQTKETPKESFKERVFSKPTQEKKERKVPKGLSHILEILPGMPGYKK